MVLLGRIAANTWQSAIHVRVSLPAHQPQRRSPMSHKVTLLCFLTEDQVKGVERSMCENNDVKS